MRFAAPGQRYVVPATIPTGQAIFEKLPYALTVKWRVVVLASVPNLVVGRRLLDGLATMTPTVESTGGAQRQLVVTAVGADAPAAAASAVERLRQALGPEVEGHMIVQSVDPDAS